MRVSNPNNYSLKDDNTDSWELELTDAQYRRLESMAASQGLSMKYYIRFLVQDHAQKLLDDDAENRRRGLRIVDVDCVDSDEQF